MPHKPGAGGGRGRGGNASGVDEKLRKQLKAQMKIYQDDMEAANEKALDSYIDKESDYEQLMKARHDNEIKYYNDSIDYFKKIFGEKKTLRSRTMPTTSAYSPTRKSRR